MDNQETKCLAPAVALAFLGGAVAGVVAGLLLAPKSGEETRRALKGYARKAEEEEQFVIDWCVGGVDHLRKDGLTALGPRDSYV